MADDCTMYACFRSGNSMAFMYDVLRSATMCNVTVFVDSRLE